MAKYLNALNEMMFQKLSQIPRACFYGQNLNNGTFISGLTKNIRVHETGRIINTPNIENTLCGMGFGMLLSGIPAVYFVKQLDFMLLGMDHFVNTFNYIRCSRKLEELGSFSIIMLVCDQGMQGPQSSFDSFGDFCSVARIPCYTLTNAADAPVILDLVARPGFRMIGLSSRLCKTELLPLAASYAAADASVFQYADGADATIVCYNFALAEGHALAERLRAVGRSAALFSANYVPEPDLQPVLASARRTGRVIALDDSKSVHLPCYRMLHAIEAAGIRCRSRVVLREQVEFGITPDRYPVPYDELLAWVNAAG